MKALLLLDKPEEITSHQLVLQIRRLLHSDKSQPKLKVGHTGTLDMAAGGLMALTIGKATKSTALFQGLDKIYTTTARLGQITDTYDRHGKIIEEKDWQVSSADLEEALHQFRGTYPQLPPSYSAKKIGGRKAYQLAKKGKEVPLKPKMVQVDQLEILKVHLPFVDLHLHCSSGTYVRRLVKDWGDQLGCGAHVSQLRRHTIGPFSLESARQLEELEGKTREEWEPLVLPLEEALKQVEDHVIFFESR